jgi:voltage-gated sodium channel type IV alpha
MDYGGEWVNTQANFDNFINGLTTFFTVMTSEGWVTVMWQSVDCAVEFHTPITNNKLFSTFFFIVFIIAGALFILNLFVGVVIGQFGTEKEKLVRNNLITDLQEEYCTTMVKVYQAEPVEVY